MKNLFFALLAGTACALPLTSAHADVVGGLSKNSSSLIVAGSGSTGGSASTSGGLAGGGIGIGGNAHTGVNTDSGNTGINNRTAGSADNKGAIHTNSRMDSHTDTRLNHTQESHRTRDNSARGVTSNLTGSAHNSAAGTASVIQAAEPHTLDRAGVVALQQALRAEGFYSAGVDGIWGNNTSAALHNYQRRNNLTVNGQLDARTAQHLGLAMEPTN
jgi:hypothetical protein